MSDFCVAKCQTHPLSGKSSVVPLKFRREIARGSHSGTGERVSLAFGDIEGLTVSFDPLFLTSL